MPTQISQLGPLRVCAVSYLNTVPLVWGMLHGEQRGVFELDFQIPSVCADALASGTAAIGTVPSVELIRQNLEVIPGCGISSFGEVRSIFVISKCPPERIRTFAADTSSRTSVVLARIILGERYGVAPAIIRHKPELESMLEAADAALVIGDPALRIDPPKLPFKVLDLGKEWTDMTGLPMVCAVWAGRRELLARYSMEDLAALFRESYRFGLARIDDIVRLEAHPRGLSEDLARTYLTKNMVFELGEREYRGLERFLKYARELDRITAPGLV